MTCYCLGMLNTPVASSLSLITIAVQAHATAAKNLEGAARRVREHGAGPLAEIYEMEMEHAFECFELACDDLRETRDGYRHTYPHPVAMQRHGNRYPIR